MHIPDLDLLRRIAQRDRAAFEALYRRYHRRVFGFVSRWIHDPCLVEEVVDDVLFVVWTKAEEFEERSQVSTWIFGIAYRRAMAEVRRRPQDQPLDEDYDPGLDDAELDAVVLRDALVRALDDLSAEQRAVVTLTFFEGCSYPEISRILDCPVNTVKTRMFFARKQLRTALMRQGSRRMFRATEGRHAN